MNDKAILPIIKQTEKALTPLPKAEPKKKRTKRAKPPKDDLSEKAFSRQIDEILTGNKKMR